MVIFPLQMMTEKILAQKRFIFDQWAPSYDFILTTVFYQAVHKRLLEYVDLPTNAQVLDLGCGTGRLLERIVQKYPHITGTGFDLSPKMLQKARERNKYPAQLSFVEGNVEAMPFGDNSFDAILNTISFLHYPHPETVFTEIKRVLKSGGKYYLADYTNRWAEEPQEIKMSAGGIRIYSPIAREKLAETVGLTCIKHQYLLGPIMLSIFAKP